MPDNEKFTLEYVIEKITEQKMSELGQGNLDNKESVKRAFQMAVTQEVLKDTVVEKYYQEQKAVIEQMVDSQIKNEILLTKRGEFGYFAIYTVFIALLLGMIVNQVTGLLSPFTENILFAWVTIIVSILLLFFFMFSIFKEREIHDLIIKRIFERVKNDITFK